MMEKIQARSIGFTDVSAERSSVFTVVDRM
jgi:hypothetical protein